MNNEKYLKLTDVQNKIKTIKEKSSILSRRKLDAKSSISENNVLKPTFAKNTSEIHTSTNLLIKWDYMEMMQNLNYCPIPRFLIVEVKIL